VSPLKDGIVWFRLKVWDRFERSLLRLAVKVSKELKLENHTFKWGLVMSQETFDHKVLVKIKVLKLVLDQIWIAIDLYPELFRV